MLHYKSNVQITVYDAEGKEVEKLVNEEQQPGTYQVEFSTTQCHSRESAIGGGNLSADRQDLQDGYYYYSMTAGEYSSEKKWFCINNLLRSNTMKTFLHTLFFILLVTQICFAQQDFWKQTSGPPAGWFCSPPVMNSSGDIFGASDTGYVYKSTDNGVKLERT